MANMNSEPETEKDIADRLISALQQDEFVLYTQSILPLVPQRDDRAFKEIFVRSVAGGGEVLTQPGGLTMV